MEEKIIVVIAGAVTTFGGAIKAYFDYRSKMAEFAAAKEAENAPERKEPPEAQPDEPTDLDKLLKNLAHEFKPNKILIVKLSKDSEFATKSKVIVTHEVPSGDISFILEQINVDAFRATIEDLLQKHVLAIPQVYRFKNKSFKELLFKHAFVSCYAFTIHTDDEKRLGSLFMLYREETILSEFDISDIKKIMSDIAKYLK